jgi:ATP-binding cassette subfamily F protein uup
MAVDAGEASGRVVFEAERISKAFGGVSVVRDYTQRIMRGDRIGLIGPNGAGKTTLLRLLTGELEPDSGTVTRGARVQIAYFDQQRAELDPGRSVADSVNDGNDTVVVGGQPRHVLGYLADFLFPRERAVSPVKSLSGGERNRLMLARLFARPANVLVLDEPTNDLDIETLELLEELIADFAGTVLLVSHDRAFLDNIVTSTIAFEGEGRVVEYVGGWADYQRQRERPRPERDRGGRPRHGYGEPRRRVAEAGDPASAETSRHSSRTSPGRWRKLSFNEQREYDALPERIAALEDEQRRLTDESESPEFYKTGADHIRDVLARITSVGEDLETALARWLELEERAAPRT